VKEVISLGALPPLGKFLKTPEVDARPRGYRAGEGREGTTKEMEVAGGAEVVADDGEEAAVVRKWKRRKAAAPAAP
jgi:hypothetical protein